mmetsp:Transcript_22182/g.30968  ORF Transcript_22182/g.30968 Transcript_22182/m.30968 type:complete len:212 (-) Transcript_22182:111-746(-)
MAETKGHGATCSSKQNLLGCARYDWDFKDVYFRGVIREDLKQLMVLHDILFPVKYSESFFNSLLTDEMLTIVAFDAKTSKLIAVSTSRVEEDTESCYTRRAGYISTLGVDPGFRRCGLGRFLLQRTVDMLVKEKNISEVRLHVKADNIPAINMYYKAGFHMSEHLVNHYYFDGNYHDALLLVRKSNASSHEAPVRSPLDIKSASTTTCPII